MERTSDTVASALVENTADRLESIVQKVKVLWMQGRNAMYSDADVITIMGAVELLRKIKV
jgi:hypothetical protein